MKNNLITAFQLVIFLSETYEGKKHDKAICDEEGYVFTQGTILRQDSGYQGYAPQGVIIEQPMKKPRARELTRQEKDDNTAIARKRVTVEHTIGGCKRSRIVKDRFRGLCDRSLQMLMKIACGLHNFRVRSPARAYVHTPAHVKFNFQT